MITNFDISEYSMIQPPRVLESTKENTLWSQIILQAAEQESFIKHAVIALGALSMTTHDTTGNGDISGRAPTPAVYTIKLPFSNMADPFTGYVKRVKKREKLGD